MVTRIIKFRRFLIISCNFFYLDVKTSSMKVTLCSVIYSPVKFIYDVVKAFIKNVSSQKNNTKDAHFLHTFVKNILNKIYFLDPTKVSFT